MTAPAQAGARFLIGLLLGAGLGLLYGFLRPLRRKRNAPADLIFVTALLTAWVYHSFAICRGDIRLSGIAALGLGALSWDLSAGRLLRPVFHLFWKSVAGIFSIITMPLQKFFAFFGEKLKKVFASVKKRGTIYWNNRRHNRRRSGGKSDEQADRSAVQLQTGLSPRKVADQAGTAGSHRIVYGDTGGAVYRHQARRGKK